MFGWWSMLAQRFYMVKDGGQSHGRVQANGLSHLKVVILIQLSTRQRTRWLLKNATRTQCLYTHSVTQNSKLTSTVLLSTKRSMQTGSKHGVSATSITRLLTFQWIFASYMLTLSWLHTPPSPGTACLVFTNLIFDVRDQGRVGVPLLIYVYFFRQVI